MASSDSILATLNGGVTNLANLVTAVRDAFPRINGTFTLANATTTVVAEPSIAASGIVVFTPTNAAAALTQRTRGLYHDQAANVAGKTFTVSTQSGTASGTETFEYLVVNPS